MMKFICDIIVNPLTLNADELNLIQFSIDASFAVHPDMKIHSSMTMTMGKGAMIASSCKQKIDTQSSTEAELVAINNNAAILPWTQLFVKAQDALLERFNVRWTSQFCSRHDIVIMITATFHACL